MKKLAALSSLLLMAALPLAAQPADQSETTIGPNYTPTPELVIPHGAVSTFTMESTDSKIYPGIARIDNETMAKRDAWGNRGAAPLEGNSRPQAYSRRVGVYVPAAPPRPATPPPATGAPARAAGAPPPAAGGGGRGARAPMPFMIVQDGIGYMARMVPVLDSLIAAKKIPAMVVIFINSGGSDAQNSERGLEYDAVDGRYAEFVESEVLPRVTKETGVTFTSDPEGRAAMGGSSGAAAAFTMAWFHPEWYHRVLSYSGTFVNQASPQVAATPRGAWEYHETLIPNAPKKPIRIWMEVGENDLHYTDPEQSFHNWPMANQRMAAALKAKGYSYRFVFARGAMHVDARVVAQTLPEALEWTWQGYPR